MDPAKSKMASGFSQFDKAARAAMNTAALGHNSEGSKTSITSTHQASHSETDDTDDNDDEYRRGHGGVSLIDHPDPSPSPSHSFQGPTTKARKRSRRGAAKRGYNAHGGVPSSIPEETSQSFSYTYNNDKMSEGEAMDQDDEGDENPIITPVMQRRARNMASQGTAGASSAQHGQRFMPARFGGGGGGSGSGGQHNPPVGGHFPGTTPSNRFGGPQYSASDSDDVFATPTTASWRPAHLSGGPNVSAPQGGGQRSGLYPAASPFDRHLGPNNASSGVFDPGNAGPADVMYRVPAPGNPGAQTEPRRLHHHSRVLSPDASVSSPQYETPTGHTNHNQSSIQNHPLSHQYSSVSANIAYQEKMRTLATSGLPRDAGRFASPAISSPAANKTTLVAVDAPGTVVRVSGDSNAKMMAPPSNNALFQTSGVPAPSTIAARSDLLNELTNTPTGRPSPDVALSDRYFPFEYCWEGVPDGMERGVIRIKNVPYATTRSEVIASLGRSTKILNDADEGVHIIMERLNSKTHDVFIELINKHEATQTVDKFNAQAKKHQYLRLGKRVCQVVMSSQEELMREMFPTARGLTWNGTTPAIDGTPHETWETFKGFINDEEFGMVRRFTEYPHRSPFARDCPQRPYEFQISTLKKFPWHAPEMISFRDRWMLYYYTERLIETLRQTLDHPKHDQAVSRLNEQLMKRLHAACMACPGFTASQKNNITVWAGYEESLMGLPKTHMPMPRAAGDELAVVKVDAFDRNEAVGKYHLPKNPFLWNHIHALRPKAGVPFDLLEWYIAIIRESTMIDSMDHMDFEQQQFAAEMEQVTQCTDYFGRLWCEVGLSTYTEEKLCLLKLKGIGERELNIVKHVIARALDPSKTIPARLQGPN